MMTRTMPLMHKIAAFAFSLALVAAFIPATAFASPLVAQDVTGMSGNSGSCQWEIDQDGKLIIEPTMGSSGTLDSFAHLYGGTGKPPWTESNYAYYVKSVEVRPGVKAGESLHSMFTDLDHVRTIDLSGLDTSDTKDMSSMFYRCSSLTSITFGRFSTSQVTDMGSMFFGCSGLSSLNLSHFDTRKVENMRGMFLDCSNLANVGVSSFSTPNLKNTRVMFAGCKSLVALDLSNFDTSSVNDMGGMFNECSSLKSLNISSFDTSKVMDMSDFMSNCKELERVDIGDDFEFIGDACRLPAGMWYAADGKLYSADEIAANPDIPGPFTKEEPDAVPPTVTVPDDEPVDVSSGEDLKIKTDIEPEDLVCVQVDGEVVDPSNYTVDAVTGDIVFKPAFLETLANGDHEIGFVTSKGTVSADIKITGSSAKPNKPDDSDQNQGQDQNQNQGGSSTPGTSTGYGHVMYRMYNPNSGEHFFTTNPTERDRLDNLGWDYEGIAWTAPASGNPVYRLYNGNAGEHHYTKDSEERQALIDAGWDDEGIGWYADIEQRVPLYRVYNPNEYANNHHYTTSIEERDTLVELGWQNEGIGWHGIAA